MTQVLLQATAWEAGQHLSLFQGCVKPYVYAVFLRLPCESIPPRQRFHLADKLITARESNAHVRPARTKSSALYAVSRIRVQSGVYFGVYWTHLLYIRLLAVV